MKRKRYTARNFVAQLDGGQEVAELDTSATGHAILRLNHAETVPTYRLIVANIENVA